MSTWDAIRFHSDGRVGYAPSGEQTPGTTVIERGLSDDEVHRRSVQHLAGSERDCPVCSR